MSGSNTATTTDLAQAIVSLAKAAEKRRGARADLVDATDTIAKAMRKQLRSGDSIIIDAVLEEKEQVTYRAASVGRLQWEDILVKSHPEISGHADVLLRNGAIFGLEKAEGRYITEDLLDELRAAIQTATDARANNQFHDEVYPEDYQCHPATDVERRAFVKEAPAVVLAFRELLESQADNYQQIAGATTKIVIK